MFKTSRNIIVIGICLPLIIATLATSSVFISNLTVAACLASLIMQFGGFYKREEEKLAMGGAPRTEEEYYAQRREAFQQRYEEGKKLVEQDRILEEAKQIADKYDVPADSAIITMVDEEGRESAIIIKSDGEMEIEGDPNPEVLKAAQLLKESIKLHGPHVIAQEIQRQISQED